MAGDAKLKHLESAHQQQVIEWARMASRSAKYPMLEMLHCSLNGVKLTKTQAVIAKSQGMLSGVPDLFLPVTRGKYHGLYIEMKHGSNTLTDNQKKFLQNAANVGFAVSVCYSAQEAIKRIEDYYKD